MVDFKIEGKATIDPERISADLDDIIAKLDRATEAAERFDEELDKLDNKSVRIEIEILGEDKLDRLEAMLAELEKTHTLTVRIDIADSDIEKLIEIDDMARDRRADIEINVDGALKATSELEALDRELDNKQKDMDKAKKSTDGFKFSIMSLLPVFTAIIPILAVAGAGIIGLAGAAATMIPAFIGIYAAVRPAMTAIQQMDTALTANTKTALASADSYNQVYNILEKNSKQFRALSPEVQQVAVNYELLKNKYAEFQKAVDPAVMPMLSAGMALISKLLGGLPALVKPAAEAIHNFLDDFAKRLDNPAFQSFFNTMNNNMYTLVSTWLTGFLNIIQGLASLFDAFMPISVDMSQGFQNMTAAFAKWAAGLKNSPGFQNFVEYVKKEGPIVLNLLSGLVTLIGKIAVALSGMGGGALSALDRIVQGINHFADANPGLFKVIVNLALLGVTASKIWPMLAPIAAFLMTPVGAVVAVIVGLAAAFIYLYDKSSQFREFVKKELGPMWNELVQAGQQFVQWAKSIWPEIKTIWEKYGKQIENIIKDLWNAVVNIIKGAIQIIEGIVDVFLGILTGHWSRVWTGVGKIVDGAWQIIWTIIKNGAKIILNVLEIFGKMVWGLITNAWDAVVNYLDQKTQHIRNQVKAMFDGIVADFKMWGSEIWQGVNNAVAPVVNFFEGLPGRIKKIFDGAVNWLYNSGKNIVQGLLDGLLSLLGKLQQVAGQIGDTVNQGVQQVLKMGSPSKVMFDHGVNVVLGIINGLLSKKSSLQSAAEEVAKTIDSVFGDAYTKDIGASISGSLNNSMGSGSLGASTSNRTTVLQFANGAVQITNPTQETASSSLTRTMTNLAVFGMHEAPAGTNVIPGGPLS